VLLGELHAWLAQFVQAAAWLAQFAPQAEAPLAQFAPQAEARLPQFEAQFAPQGASRLPQFEAQFAPQASAPLVQFAMQSPAPAITSRTFRYALISSALRSTGFLRAESALSAFSSWIILASSFFAFVCSATLFLSVFLCLANCKNAVNTRKMGIWVPRASTRDLRPVTLYH
jgi:hypothetical protein